MNFTLKKRQKFLVLFSFLFLYLFTPVSNVFALSGPTEDVIFGVTPGVVNQVKYGCTVDSLKGAGGGFVTSVSKLVGADFADLKCALETGALDLNQDGTGYIFTPSSGNPNNSLLGLAVSASQMMITEKPASGMDFIQDKVYALTHIGTVSAQDPATYYPGTGSDLLRPIQSFWGWSVNFVFSFLVLLILAIAFAIIFRSRLGGKADITIQNSIPNIALALILVPLSYAISGLFIDAVTLGTNAVHGFLIGPGAPGSQVYQTRNDDGSCVPYNPNDVTTENCDRGLYVDDDRINIWNVRGKISIGEEIGNALGSTINGGTTDGAVGIILGLFRAIDSVIGLLTGGTSGQFAWLGSIINFFVSILTLWISLKIAWQLFKKFLTFLLFPIFSPFIFATIALPGNGLNAVINYAKIMGAASLNFIATYAMFILTLVFTSEGFQSQFPDIRTSGYIPPLLGLESILASGTDTQLTGITALVLTLVGIGIFFNIPNTLNNIDKALGADKIILPQFATDAFASMKESFGATYGLASRGVGLTRTTVQGGINSVKALQDGKGLVNRWRARSQLAYDKDLGLNPSDKGSARNAKYVELNKKRQGANADIERGRKLLNNPNATAAQKAEGEQLIQNGQKQMNKIQKEAELFDIKGFYGDDVKAPSLKVSFDFEDVFKGPFNRSALRTLKAQGPQDIELGKIVFEAEEFEFDNSFEIKAYKAGTPTEADPAGPPEGAAINISNDSLVSSNIFLSDFGTEDKLPTYASLVLKAKRVDVTKPKEIKITALLRVKDAKFFGDVAGSTDPNVLRPLWSVALLKKFRFSYNDLLSGRFNVTLTAGSGN